jgi:hypothetical protein
VGQPDAGLSAPPVDRSAEPPRPWATVTLVVVAVAIAVVLVRGPNSTPEPNQILLVVSLVALGFVIRLERRRPSLQRSTVWGLTGGLLLVAVAVPPMDSNDVWAYATYGRMLAHYHDSPYTHSAADYPRDPFARKVDPVWQGTRSVYGPLFTVVSAGGMAVAGDSRGAARLFFQVLSALAVVAAMVLIDRRSADPMALAVLGVNPVTIVSFVNGGHNDALVGLAVLGAVFLVLHRRHTAAGVALALGAMVKIIALLPMAAIAVWVWRREGLRRAATLVGVTVALVALGIGLSGGRDVLEPLGRATHHITANSIWHGAQRWLEDAKLAEGFGRAEAQDYSLARVGRFAQVTVLGLAALLVARRLDRPTPVPAVGAAVLAYMLGAMYVYPWYVAWALPALALSWDSRLMWFLLGHAGAMQVAAFPDPRLFEADPLLFLNPLQRLRDDVFLIWMPLLTLVLLVVVVFVTLWPWLRALARPRRAPAAAREPT